MAKSRLSKVGPSWRAVLKKAWSVRFNAMAAGFMALEMTVPFLTTKVPPYVFVSLGLVASIGAIWARVLIQTNMQQEVSRDSINSPPK